VTGQSTRGGKKVFFSKKKAWKENAGGEKTAEDATEHQNEGNNAYFFSQKR